VAKDMFDIKYEFKPFSKIACFGNEDDKHIHWFALTDSYFYIDLGNKYLLQYTFEFQKKHDLKSAISDYYLQQIINDIYSILPIVNESIPDSIYAHLRNNYNAYINEVQNDNVLPDEQVLGNQFVFSSWLSERAIDTGYLVNGPLVRLFRCNDKLLIVWECEEENRWTVKAGQIEIEYVYFLSSVKSFLLRFLNDMEQRVSMAIAYEWGDIQIDKQQLLTDLSNEIELYSSYFDSRDMLNHTELITDWNRVNSTHLRIVKRLQH
jgi:hypothetical protein